MKFPTEWENKTRSKPPTRYNSEIPFPYTHDVLCSPCRCRDPHWRQRAGVCIPIWLQHMPPAAAWVVAVAGIRPPLPIAAAPALRRPVLPTSRRPHVGSGPAVRRPHRREARSRERSNGAAPENASSSSGNTLTIHVTFQTKMAAQHIAGHHEILRHLLQ